MNQNLSVILVSYNTKEITSECLSRLKTAISYTEEKLNNKVEVIVVDNDSQDGSVEMIRQDHSWVKVIATGQNLGFGVGNNVGIKQSKYPYILLLNTDAYIEKDTLEKSLTFFAEHPDCDLFTCRLTFKNHTLQPNAGFLPTPFRTAIWLLGFEAFPGVKDIFPSVHKRNHSFYSQIRQPEWVMGAYFMFKREVFEKTLGFDEKIFMYMEEVEWCIRIKKLGFKTYFSPDFSVVHLGGASSGFNIGVPLYREMEGLKYVYKKHYPAWQLYLKIIIMLGCLMRIIAFSLLGKFSKVKAYMQVLQKILK